MPKNNKLGCSYATQQKLAFSLKNLMETEMFEKISVSDITSNCGLHRQTFYYHFEDKYELLEWIVYEQLIKPFVTDFKIDNVFEKIYNMFSAMNEERKFYQNSLKINTEELSRYINKIAYEYIMPLVRSVKADNLIEDNDRAKDAVAAEFLSYGITGVVICWIQKGMKDSPEIMAKRIEKIVGNAKMIAEERN